MYKLVLLFILLVTAGVCSGQAIDKAPAVAASGVAVSTPLSGPFSSLEIRGFAALAPIDSHTHVYERSAAFYAMLKKLNLHILDILVDDDTIPEFANFTKEAKDAWTVVHAGQGRVAMCTTFDEYKFSQPDFSKESIRQLNDDFSHGAIAVKFYKVVGMEIKDSKGNYLLPDNPVFQPIFKDIAAHNKTLIAHLADPNSVWEAPILPRQTTTILCKTLDGICTEKQERQPNRKSYARAITYSIGIRTCEWWGPIWAAWNRTSTN